MNEISPHIGREQVFEALGKSWRLSRWERRVWWELLDWARSKIPDPVETINKHLEKMPEKAVKHAVEAALNASRTFLSITSPEVQAMLQSMEGMVKTMYLLLLEHQKDVTEDEAYAIVMGFGAEEIQRRFGVALGRSTDSGGNALPPAASQ